MKIETYKSWSKRNEKKCRTFSHYGEKGSQWFRVTNRPTILLREGFKCISGGLFDDCTTTTNERIDGKVVRLSPKEAVAKFVEYDHYSEVVYYPHSCYYGHFIVWAKY